MKTCSQKTCTNLNPQLESAFYKDSKAPDGLRAACKTCTLLKKKEYFSLHRERELEKLKQWKKLNPERVREGNLRNNYGITLDDYNRMLKEQNFCCAICGTDKPGGGNNAFCIDHSHRTEKVRSLLCFTCNIALGMIKDKPHLVARIGEYLLRHEETF